MDIYYERRTLTYDKHDSRLSIGSVRFHSYDPEKAVAGSVRVNVTVSPFPMLRLRDPS